MERFVELVVAGGVALVAGLWLAELSGALAGRAGSLTLVLGAVLALSGTVAVAAGLRSEVEWTVSR